MGTKFVTRNTAVQVQNGTSGYATRFEHADFPMTNLVLRDRYTPWVYASTNSVTVNIDVRSTFQVNCAAILGINRYGNSSFGTFTVSVGSGIPPASFSGLGTVTFPTTTVDAAWYQPSFISYASNQTFRIGLGLIAGPISIGQVWLGNMVNTTAGTFYGADLGVTFTSRQTTHSRSRIITPTIAGLPVVTDYGNPWRSFSLGINDWPTSQTSVGIIADAIAAASSSVLYIDHADAAYECLAEPGGVRIVHKPGGVSGLLDVSIDLRTMP